MRTNCLPTKWYLRITLPVMAPVSFSMADTFTTKLGAMRCPICPQCSWTPLNFHSGMTDLPIYPVVAGLATIESKIECMKKYLVPLFWGTSLIQSWAWVFQTQHQYILHQSNEIFPWTHCKDWTKYNLVWANCVTLMRQCDQVRRVCLSDRKGTEVPRSM